MQYDEVMIDRFTCGLLVRVPKLMILKAVQDKHLIAGLFLERDEQVILITSTSKCCLGRVKAVPESMHSHFASPLR